MYRCQVYFLCNVGRFTIFIQKKNLYEVEKEKEKPKEKKEKTVFPWTTVCRRRIILISFFPYYYIQFRDASENSRKSSMDFLFQTTKWNENGNERDRERKEKAIQHTGGLGSTTNGWNEKLI